MSQTEWGQYAQAYRAIWEKLAEILVKLDTVADPQTAQLLDDVGNLLYNNPAKYLPVRLTDGTAFYVAGGAGGGSGGLVQNQILNETGDAWINEPFARKVMGSQDQALLQRATTHDLIVQLRTAGAEYDARQIRALTASDVVSAAKYGTWNVDNLLNPHPVAQTARTNLKTQPEREDIISLGGTVSPNGAGVQVIAGVAGQRIKVYDAGFHGAVDGLHYFYFGTSTTPSTKRFCTSSLKGLVHETFVQPRVSEAGEGLYLFCSVAETDMPYDVGYVQEA